MLGLISSYFTLLINHNMITSNSIAPIVNLSTDQILEDCKKSLNSGDINHAMEMCRQFLAHYPLVKTGVDKDAAAYQNYIRVASTMLKNNHNYEAVINLLQTKNNMLDFVNSFYQTRDKKGFHFPTPVIQAEDATFVYHFCVGFNKMIGRKLGEE